MLSVAGMLLCAYVLVVLSHEYSSQRSASPNAIYAALVLLHFALPAVLISWGLITTPFENFANADYGAAAVIFVLACLICFQAGTFLAVKTFRVKAQRQWSAPRLIIFALTLTIIGWLARIIVIMNGAYFQIARTDQGDLEGPYWAIVMTFEAFPLYALMGLTIYRWSKEGSHFFIKHFMAVTWLFELIYWIPTGRKEPVILALILPFILRYLINRKLPGRAPVIALVTVITLLFPAAFMYRTTMEANSDARELGQTISDVSEVLSSDSGQDISATEIIFGRLSLIEPVAACIRLIDDDIWSARLGKDYFDGFVILILEYFGAESRIFIMVMNLVILLGICPNTILTLRFP